MKNLFLILSTVFFSFSLHANDLNIEQVPTKVQDAISFKFNNIKDLSWETHGKNYQAEFYIDEQEYEVIVNSQGKILATYEDISAKELPVKVQSSIQSIYTNYKIEDAEILKIVEEIFYKVEIKNSFKEATIYYDSRGEKIKRPRLK